MASALARRCGFTGLASRLWSHSCGPTRSYSKPAADCVLLNANIWTGDPRQPRAQALASAGGQLVYVGTNDQVNALRTPKTEVVDGQGRLVTPGFIDTHLHFLMGGERLLSVQLTDATTKDQFISRIGDYARRHPGKWIIGGDWDHTLWGGELPERSWIDSVTPNNPVWLNRKEGHMYLANTAALKIAGVPDDVADVSGGSIMRDLNGKPTGLLKDNALDLVYPHVPVASQQESDAALDAASDYAMANGVTSVHHMTEPSARNRGGIPNDLAVFDSAHRRGKLRTRVYCAIPIEVWETCRDRIAQQGRGDEMLRIGAIKGYVDGSLGSHTAAMFEPYIDTPGYSGDLVHDMRQLEAWITAVDAAGLQLCIHAIGDRANHTLLDIFQRVAVKNGPRDRRFRIEHAQHLHPSSFARLAQQRVIAAMQPYHAIDDGRWAASVLGQKRCDEGAYPFRSLLHAGATLAFGSDWFVAPPSALLGIHAAVTRLTLSSPGAPSFVFAPEQRITVEQALRAYTVDAAFAGFEEGVKGTLSAGKLADWVMLDRNIFTVPPEELRYAQVLMTALGGRVVFQRHTSQSCAASTMADTVAEHMPGVGAACPACFGPK